MFNPRVYIISGSTCGPVDCSVEGSGYSPDEEGTVTASTGVFVLDPNEKASKPFTLSNYYQL